MIPDNAALSGGYMRVVTDDICKRYYGNIVPFLFCADDKEENTNICYGDIGTGFVTLYRGQKVLVGIASLVMRACSALEPTGFVRVSQYLNWIKTETGIIG